MPAAKLNLPAIEKGATYRYSLTCRDATGEPIDFTGCTAKAQVRIDAAAADVLLELSTENARLTITPAAGRIDFYIADDVTAALVGAGGVYDLEVYHPNGDTSRLIEGRWPFKAEVTRG